MENEVNLNGTEYIQNIPGIYFDATSMLVDKVGEAKQASKYIARIGTAAGGIVNLTVNLAEDPDNPGKVIASTVVGTTTYIATGVVVDALVFGAIGAATASLGIATAPVWLTVAGVGVAVAATTYIGSKVSDWLYDQAYGALESFEEFEVYSPQVVGTATKEEFIINSAASDPNFCKNIFPQYKNYRQIVEIRQGGGTLADYIRYNSSTREAQAQTNGGVEKEKEMVEVITQETQADKLTLNNQTYDITTADDLAVRNQKAA